MNNKYHMFIVILLLAVAPVIVRAGSNALFQLEIQNSATPTLSTPSSQGGGSSIGNQVNNLPLGSYSFSGVSFSGAKIEIMKDGEAYTQVVADAGGNFSGLISGLNQGTYTFGFIVYDKNNHHSDLVTQGISITGSGLVTGSIVELPPTVTIIEDEGKKLNLTGYGKKDSNIDIVISSNSKEISKISAQSLNDGYYIVDIGKLEFEEDYYDVFVYESRAGAVAKTKISFSVSNKRVILKEGECLVRADLNCDGRVNLIDFSIASYWYNRTLTNDFLDIEKGRLNGDGQVNLIDFSIMAYFWTG
ncbi:MAG: dockerin type I repeat-containing protein [Patescibacteria group bacterium]